MGRGSKYPWSEGGVTAGAIVLSLQGIRGVPVDPHWGGED